MDRLGNAPEPTLRHPPTPAHDFLSPYTDILTLWDIVVGILAGYATFSIYLQYQNFLPPAAYIAGPFVREVILATCVAAILLQDRQTAPDHQFSLPYKLLLRLLFRNCAVIAALISVPVLTSAPGDDAGILIITWCLIFCVITCASRGILVAYIYHLAKRGALREAVVVVGAPDVAGRLAAQLAETVAIVGIFDEMENPGNSETPSCAMTELLELARSGAVDTVVVALHPTRTADAATIVRHLQSVPIQITVCSDANAPVKARRKQRRVGNVSMDVVADRPLRRRDLLTKSIIDKVAAGLLLILLSLLLLAIAIAIAWDSPGPVIFCQRRSGWGGASFTIFKFRTMRHEPHMAPMFQTARNDPRCTRIGHFLRRTSLDELPQLWNVLRGDMSLVGPRPHAELLHEDSRIACTIVANYAQRHRVKPGLTGWAQINGSRGAIRTTDALRRRVAYDLYYIEHWSVWLDLKIVAATPLAILKGENAY